MKSALVSELLQIVEEASDRLSDVPDAEASGKPAPEKWAKKEILGHLVDSAANNHQRFVRAQLAAELVIAEYQPNEWAALQRYLERPWLELIEFWRLYNRHLAHVLGRIPEEKAGVICRIGAKEPITLGEVAEGYLAHLKHHLGQLGAAG